ncbi:radical SAM/SPASM domain-containing protein [Chloroflexota bacterium]
MLPRIIQIEVTTACQLRCVFCPHTVLAKQWNTAHLSWETFSSLLPFVRHAKLVHLQGWGEPLLHPHLWDMAAAIKERRGRVSLTTNALLLDKAATRELCHIGFDLVAISVAGARAETNDSLRAGSHFNHICANISYLCQLRPRPKVNLVMQMMKSNMEELPELVTLAARLGVDEVITPNLDYTPADVVDALKVFAPSPNPGYAELVEEAKRKGKELGIKVHIYPLSPQDDVLMCDAEPASNVWISVSGEVAPCPYLALACHGQIPRVFWEESEYISRFSFGNVATGLDHVLNDQPARSFRETFARRIRTDRLSTVADIRTSTLPKVSSSLVSFFELVSRMTPTAKTAELPPPPDICRKCYKLYGL